jgi:hypothetical protein
MEHEELALVAEFKPRHFAGVLALVKVGDPPLAEFNRPLDALAHGLGRTAQAVG